MNFEIESQQDDRVMFVQGILHAESPNGRIEVKQSLNGAWLFLSVGSDRYSISVEKLTVAWLNAIQSARSQEDR